MDEALKIGDVVQLKSGGPLMTVRSIVENNQPFNKIWCEWFTKDQEHKNAGFPEASLIKTKTE